MMDELNFLLGLQIKQMEDKIFFNQSKYIKEMLKKSGLEDSKPTKTPMSTKIKQTKDDKAKYVDSTKYREQFFHERALMLIHVEELADGVKGTKGAKVSFMKFGYFFNIIKWILDIRWEKSS
nr:retrovirus-related Pol polyprotein from transposon TNT 1-94 [Tanacetum cinerariifolium]